MTKVIPAFVVGIAIGFVTSTLMNGTGSSDDVDHSSEYQVDSDGNYMIQSPYTKQNLVENAVDADGDGVWDSFGVMVDYKMTSEIFVMRDLNDKGKHGLSSPMAISARRATSKSNKYHDTYARKDQDDDGAVDSTVILLENPDEENEFFRYIDLNMDGWIDVIQKIHEEALEESFVVHQFRLVDAVATDEGYDIYEANSGESKVKIQVEGRNWVPIKNNDISNLNK